MLEIKKISKIYKTGDFIQKALDSVSINFRESEFVSILGPSGSGKTTLLNIIGGLDKYDSGDLIINEVSTKKYTDKNWDSYRNHRIGFVFQSYNLISHQSILKNVELALTLSGVSKQERIKKAKKVLKLHDKFHEDILLGVLDGVTIRDATKVMAQFNRVLENYINPKERTYASTSKVSTK